MNIRSFLFFLICSALLMLSSASAQNNYRTFAELSNDLQQLANDHTELLSLRSIANSPDGHDIWHLTLSTGDVQKKPALAIVAGVDGSHILGIEMAVKLAESLAEHPDIELILEGQVIHIFPNMNPDASEQFFSSASYERSVNGKSTDLDRDGFISEDPFEDLNDDGQITMMRVEDPTGSWIVHPDDERVMIEADPLKSERGAYRLYTEGRDNDDDGLFNEDPAGGVNINRNFTYRHPSFEYGAGEYPVSEAENRALADLLYDTFNVYAVLTFSPNNNLSDSWTYNRSAASKRVITGILEGDEAIFKTVSDLYRDTVPQENASGYTLQHGGFPEWAYFHYARYSFTTDGWWGPAAPENENGGPSNGSDSDELNYLRWADSLGLTSYSNWQQIEHPDFPGKAVEVGGIHPFAMSAPPYSMVDSLTNLHLSFVEQLASMKPELAIENIRMEDAGRNLTRITVDLHNRGSLPTSTELGTRTQWVKPLNIEMTVDDSMQILSGMPKSQIDRLMGGESRELSWLISGNGEFSLTAGSPNAGFVSFQETIR